MWPYACLSDCKVMVKCVESDGKVIATHVSVQSHCQPVRPDRESVATHHVSHACDSAKLSIGSMRCQRCWLGGLGCFIRCHLTPPAATHAIHLCRMKQRQAAHWVHSLPTVLGRWDRLFHSLPPAATPGAFMCCHGACRCPLT